MEKRFLSCFMSLNLLLTMMPAIAFAAGDGENESEGTTEACTVTDGCTLAAGHDGECVVAESEEEPKSAPCTVNEDMHGRRHLCLHWITKEWLSGLY